MLPSLSLSLLLVSLCIGFTLGHCPVVFSTFGLNVFTEFDLELDFLLLLPPEMALLTPRSRSLSLLSLSLPLPFPLPSFLSSKALGLSICDSAWKTQMARDWEQLDTFLENQTL